MQRKFDEQKFITILSGQLSYTYRTRFHIAITSSILLEQREFWDGYLRRKINYRDSVNFQVNVKTKPTIS